MLPCSVISTKHSHHLRYFDESSTSHHAHFSSNFSQHSIHAISYFTSSYVDIGVHADETTGAASSHCAKECKWKRETASQHHRIHLNHKSAICNPLHSAIAWHALLSNSVLFVKCFSRHLQSNRLLQTKTSHRLTDAVDRRVTVSTFTTKTVLGTRALQAHAWIFHFISTQWSSIFCLPTIGHPPPPHYAWPCGKTSHLHWSFSSISMEVCVHILKSFFTAFTHR